MNDEIFMPEKFAFKKGPCRLFAGICEEKNPQAKDVEILITKH